MKEKQQKQKSNKSLLARSKFKWQTLRKSTKAWIIASSSFVLLAVVCFFCAVHLSGYDIGEWFAEYYAYFVLIAIAIILIIGSVFLYKYVKGEL